VRLLQLDGFEPGPPPELSVVAFRYVPKEGDADAFTERLLKHLQQEGRVMMSGTRIDGTFYIRCAILCFRTHLEHVDDAIQVLLDAVAALDG
jgi:aromatic-L-amino-acid decarboxylase